MRKGWPIIGFSEGYSAPFTWRPNLLPNIEKVGIDATHKGDFSMGVWCSSNLAKGWVQATIMDERQKVVGTTKTNITGNDLYVNPLNEGE